MNYVKIVLSLFFVASGTVFGLINSSSESDLQGYLVDKNKENAKYLTAIKKAGDNQAAITLASKNHVKALQAIRQKHKQGVKEYYNSAYQRDDAKRKAWQAARTALKKQYAPKLKGYWAKLKQEENAFADSMKALRAEYGAPLAEYEAASRALIKKYW